MKTIMPAWMPKEERRATIDERMKDYRMQLSEIKLFCQSHYGETPTAWQLEREMVELLKRYAGWSR
jgi:hypothetical protein